jgi:hypothetical protein
MEIFFEDRSVGVYIYFKGKIYSNFEKHFPRYFRCASCKEKVEYDGSKLKLCEEHYDEYMQFLRKKLK